MNPEDIKNILERLWQTGELLATTAFQLAYKKALFWGWTDLGLGVVFLLGAIFFYVKKNQAWKNYRLVKEVGYSKGKEITGYDSSEWTAILITNYCVSLLLFSLAVLEIFLSLNWLVNPELGAINILVSMLK